MEYSCTQGVRIKMRVRIGNLGKKRKKNWIEGICASSGSACSSGSVNPSHVVRAMGVNENGANSLVRLSLGRDSSSDEIDYVLDVLPRVIDQCLNPSFPVNC